MRPARHASNRIDDSNLLRAARECVLANGVRRSTLTGIARHAGVSRMTLYRRFPDVHSVVTALVTQEFGWILHQARDAESPGPARHRLVTTVLRAVELLRANPLLATVLETDPDMLVPYVVRHLSSTHAAAEHFLRDYLAEGHFDGSIRHGDITSQARILVLMAQTFVLSAHPSMAGTEPRSLRSELGYMLESALRPEMPAVDR